jgi:hypothetical protein
MTTTLDEAFAGGGARSAFGEHDQIGRTVGGPILSAEIRQAPVMGRDNKPTGELRTWDNGDPVLQAVIVVQTTERDPANPDDDGRRTIRIKTWGEEKKRFNDAIQAAGFSKVSEALARGNEFWAKLINIDPTTGIPRKDYEYKIIRAQAAGLDQAMGQQAPPTQGYVQQQPQSHASTAYAPQQPVGQPQGFGYGQTPQQGYPTQQPQQQPYGPPSGGPGEPPF